MTGVSHQQMDHGGVGSDDHLLYRFLTALRQTGQSFPQDIPDAGLHLLCLSLVRRLDPADNVRPVLPLGVKRRVDPRPLPRLQVRQLHGHGGGSDIDSHALPAGLSCALTFQAFLPGFFRAAGNIEGILPGFLQPDHAVTRRMGPAGQAHAIFQLLFREMAPVRLCHSQLTLYKADPALPAGASPAAGDIQINPPRPQRLQNAPSCLHMASDPSSL